MASPEQYPQIRLPFSYKSKIRKNYDKAGHRWSVCQELVVQALPRGIHATVLQWFWTIKTLIALELGMKTILDYHVFSFWVSCSSFRYHSASSLPFRARSTNMFVPQVTFRSKNRWPPWNQNGRMCCSAIPIAFSLLGMISSSVIAEMVSILQFTMLCLKSCPAILQPCSLCLYHYVLFSYLVLYSWPLALPLYCVTLYLFGPTNSVLQAGKFRHCGVHMAYAQTLPLQPICTQMAQVTFFCKPNLHLILVIGNRADLTISPSALCIQLSRLSLIMAFDCLMLHWFWRHSSNASNTDNRRWIGGISLLAHSLQLGLSH